MDADCGILPAVDDHGKLIGVVTDRDMYIALATRNNLASRLAVGKVARSQVFTCGPDDDVQTALATMKQHHVRRLPVEGFGGTVAGIVSMNDILLAAGNKGVGNAEIVDHRATCRDTLRRRSEGRIGARLRDASCSTMVVKPMILVAMERQAWRNF